MDARRRSILLLVGALAAAHIVIGLYAVYDGGFFLYGLTAPERLIYHYATSSESHITVSGATKHVSDDLCLQGCSSCPMHCYVLKELKVVCDGACRISTMRNTTIVNDGYTFAAVMKEGLLYENTTFRCYGGDCGFDIKINENQTYSSRLPDKIAR